MHTLSLRGYSAWITVDGESLPLYHEETASTTCCAWIPSTAGQAFSVWWRDYSKSRIATSGHVFVDGRDVASAIMRPGRSKPVERSGAKTSSRTLKPFKFSVLNDETMANKNDPTLQDMGTIKIEISRVKLGAEVPFKGYEAKDHGMVHEKAKKLGAHCTSYGPSKRSSASRTVAVTNAPYDPEEPGPYVTFLFRYRSEDLLRANGVIAPQKKRRPPHDDDEVIVISDSDDDGETSQAMAGRHAKKQRLELDDSEAASEPPRSDGVGLNNEVELDVNGSTHNDDVDMDDSQLDFGAPALLQEPKTEDESQTQPDDDDSQLNFGTPSLLQQSGEEESQTQREDEDPDAAPAGEDAVGGSQLEVENTTQLTEESPAY